jgi:hypothetical protein
MQYMSALQSIRVSEGQRLMLCAHASASNHTLSTAEIARAAGYDRFTDANLHYGRLGHEIAQYLGVTPPLDDRGIKPIGIKMLAEWTVDGRWRMHTALVEALRELNLA